MSTVNRAVRTPERAAPDASVKWETMAEIGTYRPMGRPFISRGHFAGRWKAQVLVNAPASPIYTGLRSSARFPAGAVLVKQHTDKQSGAPGPLFAMVKHEAGYFPDGGDWEFVVTDSNGWIEDRGPLAMCARCHAEGNADWVFGLPADAR